MAKPVPASTALPARTHATLELLAIAPRAMNVSNLSRLLHLAPYTSELGEITPKAIRTDLLNLQSAVDQREGGFFLRSDAAQLRRDLVNSLCDSGRSAAWAELPLPAQEFRRTFDVIDTQQLLCILISVNLLGGADPGRLTAITRLSHWMSTEVEAILMWLMRPPVDLARLDNLHRSYRSMALTGVLSRQIERPWPDLHLWINIGRQEMHRPGILPSLRDVMLEHLMFSGQKLEGDWSSAPAALQAQVVACSAAQSGARPKELVPLFDEALKHVRNEFGRNALLSGISGKLHLLALISDTSPAAKKRLESLTRKPRELPMLMGGYGQQLICHFARHLIRGARWTPPDTHEHVRPDDYWLLGLLCRWSDQVPGPKLSQRLTEEAERCRTAGLHWLATAMDAVRLQPAERSTPLLHAPEVLGWHEVVPNWRRSLDALGTAFETATRSNNPSADGHSRLQVVLEGEPGPYGQLITITEQRPGKNKWSAGRQVRSLRGLESTRERLPPGDNHDRRLLDALVSEAYQNYDVGYIDDDSHVWQALTGHPLVFRRHSGKLQPLEVVQEQPALKLSRRDDGWMQISMSPEFDEMDNQLLISEQARIRVVPITPEHRTLAEIIGPGLSFPADALPDLAAMMPNIAQRIELHSEIDGETDVPVDERVVLRLQPLNAGISVYPVVQPLGPGSADYEPGVGSSTAFGMRDGLPVTVRRNLSEEKRRLEQLINDNPMLDGLEQGSMEVSDPEAALELVAELQQLAAAHSGHLRLEWPQGKRIEVGATRSAQHLRMSVGAQRDWFAAEGGLSLDDERVIDLSRILQLLPSARGRFIALDDNHFIRISSQLRRKLNQLRGLADERGKIEVAPVAASALASLLDEDSELDEAFKSQIERIDKAQRLRPTLPRGLQAELRDYQLEGFRWMMRLAAMDAGACLADDMGLGKTVQTLAVLLARAKEGPAVVVAPTSVVANWAAEARRFAPDLRVRVYAETDREQVAQDLGAHDLLLISYGLVHWNIDTLASIDIATLVLDEAQAIKNPATKRYKAVRELKARFRIATTGTPIENHLGELWALFRILNPGLLGSQERFNKRFVQPIALDQRGSERDLLKRLISPFLLRRTKAQVLDELPPRTEVTLTIQPSKGEAELLSALRREAVEKLAHEGVGIEKQRFSILAALMRLRRAACHPDLVAPELKLRSSKVDELVKLVDELRDNQHRVLVFSQFVDFLTYVRAAFEEAGISYQYLDGSTSAKAREAAVNAFQGGQGDAFLLSLKAGGVGLNLTAADYVIHLDPWWNPAVEMQASDRAHRIGQTRPVTVYKLVVAGSIEEQILSLHGSKRELADSLLGDQDQAERLSADDLLALLNEAAS